MTRTTAVCLVIALGGLGSAAAEAAAANLEILKPSRGAVVRFVTLPGRIAAHRQATIQAKVPGYLKSLAVDKGDDVEAGQSLGEIEVPELVADLSRYRAELKVAEIDLARGTEAQRKAPDLVVAQTVDDARGRVEIARARIERIETLLQYARLTAPFSGVVTARFVDPGAFIPAATSSSAAGSALLTIMDFDTVRVQVPVPEREAALVQEGQPMPFTVDVLPGLQFSASVSRHSYAIDSPTQTMLVEADVANPNRTLRPGMFVTARIGVETHADAWNVPRGAVFREKATTSVFVADGNRVKKTLVTTGFDDGTRVEISSGLDGSESIILFGTTPPADGAVIDGFTGR